MALQSDNICLDLVSFESSWKLHKAKEAFLA
jgi:hypothetical protein